MSLAVLLGLMGHETRTANDGLEAMAVADQFKPDVALLDIGMPKLNGYETARRMRQKTWGREMLFVALTGWGQETDRGVRRRGLQLASRQTRRHRGDSTLARAETRASTLGLARSTQPAESV